MSDLENMQLNNAFPSALKKSRRRYTIIYKVSILEKLRSKTVSEIVKKNKYSRKYNPRLDCSRRKASYNNKKQEKQKLGWVGWSRKDLFNHVCTVYSKYCMFYFFQNVLNIVLIKALN